MLCVLQWVGMANEILSTIFFYLWQIIKTWWWLPSPIILWFPLKTFYLYRARWEIFYPKIQWMLLEVKPPKEILKPFRAMEDVFSVLWGIYDGPVWREKWCEGEMSPAPFWMSWEIVSIGGRIHFYLWIDKATKKLVESTIYSQYPDAEISVVDDYAQQVPQDIPNKDWDVVGEDYCFGRSDPFPILTYSQFFEERPEVTKEEKRLDPLDSLLEELSRVQPGGQVWFQIVTAPILNQDIPWIDESKKITEKLARRPAKPKPKSVIGEVVSALVTGKTTMTAEEKEKAKEKALRLAVSEEGEREMLITPGERFDLAAVEKKASKRGFLCWIRLVYLFRRDSYVPGFHKVARAYFNHFAVSSNYLRHWGGTRTRIHYWFRKRRLDLRKRKLFKNSVRRFPPLYPRVESKPMFPFGWCKGKGTMILNTEELATIYHFPAKVGTGVTAAVAPIEARKGGPPAGLPIGTPPSEEIRKLGRKGEEEISAG